MYGRFILDPLYLSMISSQDLRGVVQMLGLSEVPPHPHPLKWSIG